MHRSGTEFAKLSVLPEDCPAVMVLPIMSGEPPACQLCFNPIWTLPVIYAGCRNNFRGLGRQEGLQLPSACKDHLQQHTLSKIAATVLRGRPALHDGAESAVVRTPKLLPGRLRSFVG